MGIDRAPPPETAAAQPTIRGAEADPRPGRVDRDPLRAAQRRALAHATARDGLRLRDHLLATARALAAGGRVETRARGAAGGIAPTRPVGSGAHRGRQLLA